MVWHEYSRQGRVKHWDDHTANNREHGVATTWHERDQVSKRRLRRLLREEENDEDLGPYDLGSARSHRDYEIYAGIDFARRRLHRDAVKGMDPPCVFVDERQWEESFTETYRMTLRWKVDDVRQCADLQFLYLAVEDACGNVLYRYDAQSDSPEGRFEVTKKAVEFVACGKPKRLVAWPHSRREGWLKKMVYPVEL